MKIKTVVLSILTIPVVCLPALADNLKTKVVLDNYSTTAISYSAYSQESGQAGPPVNKGDSGTQFTVTTQGGSDVTYHMQVKGFQNGTTICTFKMKISWDVSGYPSCHIDDVKNTYPIEKSDDLNNYADYCSSIKYSDCDTSNDKVTIKLSTQPFPIH
jgi:hypothetical protein